MGRQTKRIGWGSDSTWEYMGKKMGRIREPQLDWLIRYFSIPHLLNQCGWCQDLSAHWCLANMPYASRINCLRINIWQMKRRQHITIQKVLLLTLFKMNLVKKDCTLQKPNRQWPAIFALLKSINSDINSNTFMSSQGNSKWLACRWIWSIESHLCPNWCLLLSWCKLACVF